MGPCDDLKNPHKAWRKLGKEYVVLYHYLMHPLDSNKVPITDYLQHLKLALYINACGLNVSFTFFNGIHKETSVVSGICS